ncbi:C45 family peptidase [Arthrobacter sp. W4I7]|uniref:C45 family autoproteolytic acyltransferase/hydolase n=1 Tax=Arthrobacter sp. W4I7 TaxID=3042296 RepID=UPI0027840990|nr:C45 family peptidase [Arthrobacter sp. W4I7]MDQ0689320.1 isopenicillin-N N-acyltransferase-like protein [Arthrobacter sp. W4I7]
MDSRNFSGPPKPDSGPGSAGGLRLLRVEGDGVARGNAHGEEFRDLIGDAMERWRESLALRENMAAKEYIEDFLSSTGFAASAKELSPDLFGEVEGIAAGSGQPFHDVLVYNLMDEEWRYERDPNIGCSTIGTFIQDGGKNTATAVLGQNMDLPAAMGGSQIVLQIESGDGPDQIVLSGAGMIGLLGVNAAGLAVCVNTLRALPAATEGLPVAFVIRELLLRRDAAAASDYLASIPHASGQHYTLGDPMGIRGYECSSEGCVAGPASRNLLHTNHILWSPYEDDANQGLHAFEAHGTHTRMSGLQGGLDQIRSLGDMQRLLSATDNGLCVLPTPARPAETFCAAEFLLTAPPVVRIAPGRPDQTRWHTIAWNDAGNLRGGAN